MSLSYILSEISSADMSVSTSIRVYMLHRFSQPDAYSLIKYSYLLILHVSYNLPTFTSMAIQKINVS